MGVDLVMERIPADVLNRRKRSVDRQSFTFSYLGMPPREHIHTSLFAKDVKSREPLGRASEWIRSVEEACGGEALASEQAIG